VSPRQAAVQALIQLEMFAITNHKFHQSYTNLMDRYAIFYAM